MAKEVFCGRHGRPEPCEECGPGEDQAREKRIAGFVKALRDHTAAMEKVSRMLEAAGVRDPGPGRRLQPPARFPGVARPQGPFQTIADHLVKSFPPDFLRGLAEDLADELARTARRRRR